MEKMAYAVVMAARKLRHYFQSFKIKVPTTFPLRDMFENREASGRIGILLKRFSRVNRICTKFHGSPACRKRKLETCSGRFADSAFPGRDRYDVTYAGDGGADCR